MAVKIYKSLDGKFRKDGAIQVGKFRMVIDTDNVSTATKVGLYGADNFFELIDLQPIGDIQRENGTPYESVAIFEDEMSLFITSNVDVKIQDQTTQTIMLPLVRDDAMSTTTVDTIIDDYNVSLTSVVGFVIGQHFRIINSDADRFYFGSILDIQGLIVTVDTPFDFEYLSGSEATGSTINMNVNGSVTPVVYTLRTGSPSIPSSVDITRIIITCIADTRVDLNLFGDLPILTRGLVLRKVNGDNFNILNVKSNAEIANLAYDFQIYDAATPSQGIDGFVSRLTFAGSSKVGVVIRINQGDNLEILIQDNLTGLLSLSVIAEGHVVE